MPLLEAKLQNSVKLLTALDFVPLLQQIGKPVVVSCKFKTGRFNKWNILKNPSVSQSYFW